MTPPKPDQIPIERIRWFSAALNNKVDFKDARKLEDVKACVEKHLKTRQVPQLITAFIERYSKGKAEHAMDRRVNQALEIMRSG